jgi:hypothetical protein
MRAAGPLLAVVEALAENRLAHDLPLNFSSTGS